MLTLAYAQSAVPIDDDTSVIEFTNYLVPIIDRQRELMGETAEEEEEDFFAEGDAVVPSEKPDETADETSSEEAALELAFEGLEHWYQFDIDNASGKVLDRLIVVNQPVPFGMGFFNVFRNPLVIKRIVTTNTAPAFAEEATSLLRSDRVFRLTITPDRSPIALEFDRKPVGAVFHLWEPEAYERYAKLKIFLHGLAIGLLAVTTALLLALWMITQAGYCANTGIFCAAGVVYLLFGFGYLPHYVQVTDAVTLFAFGGAQLLLTAAAISLVLSMTTFDETDSWVRRALIILLLSLAPIGLYVVLAAPFHLVLLRLAIAAAALIVVFAVLRQRKKGIPGVRHSVPGWLLMFSAVAAGGYYLFSPFGSYFHVELFLYAATVLGLIWIAFSFFSQVSGGPFHGFAFRDPSKLQAPVAEVQAEPVVEVETEKEPEENRYEVGLAAAKQGLWDWTTVGDQLYLSPYGYEMLGIEKSGSIRSEQDWKDRIHPDEQQAYQNALTSYMRIGAVKFAMQWRVAHEDGTYRPILMKAECIPNERGKPSRIIGTLTDLTEDGDDIESTEEVADTGLAFPKPVGVAIDRSQDSPPAKLNGGASASTDEDQEDDDITDETDVETNDAEEDEVSIGAISAQAASDAEKEETERTGFTKTQLRGEEKPKPVHIPIETPAIQARESADDEAIKETVGALYSDTAIASETETEKAEDVDAGYPGFFGRAAFEVEVDTALENQDREELARLNLRPAMLAVGIDRKRTMSAFSDKVAEDEIMASCAERLRSIADPEDVLGQLSQDRFAIFTTVPEEITSTDLARQASEILHHPFEIEGVEGEPDVTVGASLWTGEGHSAEELIMDAEEYLPVRSDDDEAKKDTPTPAPETADSADAPAAGEAAALPAASSELEKDLKSALQRFEMEVYYQPIMNLKHGRIAGFEALLRWNHPEKGKLEPKDFVPLAEKAGLIVRLNRFTLSMASLQLSQWQQFFKLEDPLFVNVNISSRQLSGDGLVSDIKEIMKSVKLSENSLRLELPETALIKDEEQANAVLAELKDLGTALVIDDYGVGHSTFERLTKFPFDVIKIDQSLVQPIDSDENSEEQIRELIKYAADKNLEVVAEGVENEAIGRKLHELGCSHAQGYIFGWPMQAMEAQAFIANYWAK